MHLLQYWKESLQFIHERFVWYRWRVLLGQAYSIWWHYSWWIIAGAIIVLTTIHSLPSLVATLPVFVAHGVLFLYEVVLYCAWYLLLFFACYSLYTAATEDPRELTIRSGLKLLLMGSVPAVLFAVSGLFDYAAAPLVWLISKIDWLADKYIQFLGFIITSPIHIFSLFTLNQLYFGLGIGASALYIFYMYELLAEDRSFKSIFRAFGKSLKVVVLSYPFLVLSHIVGHVLFLGLHFVIHSVAKYVLRYFTCGRFVPCQLRDTAMLLRGFLDSLPWTLLLLPFLVTWLGLFYFEKRKRFLSNSKES